MLWPAFSGRFLAASSALLVWLGVCHAQTTKAPGATAPAAATKSTSHPASSKSSHSSTSQSSSSHGSSSVHHAASSHHPAAVASHGKTKSKKHKRAVSWRNRGQQKIDSQRAHDIQEALIREHYLDGTPSGTWDDATQKAMQKYQADHGWQSTMTPDSRALIHLGLGPDHAHLLNPESAMTMTGGGDPPHASAVSPAASPSVPVTSTPLPAGDPAPGDQPKGDHLKDDQSKEDQPQK